MKGAALKNKITQLEKELKSLKGQLIEEVKEPETVIVPEPLKNSFLSIENQIRTYFNDLNIDPESGEITAYGQRYILFRADSLSHEFLDFIKERYADRPAHEAISIGNNFLYDNAKVIGKKDALSFHENLGLKAPIEKLSAGPIHFAFTGWANVEISEESHPSPDQEYLLKFIHHNSFEAQAWLKAGKKSDIPVCTMNCGYSAGWCEESFGMPLTTVEIKCEAKGDEFCEFVMAPSDRIEEHVGELVDLSGMQNFEISVFFKRKHIEEQLRETLNQKETLIQEIHHRVKNNLQVISSLLKVQMAELEDEQLKVEFESSINRVNTMAVVHELMYQNKDFDKIDMKSYMNELVISLIQLYSLNKKVEVDVTIDVPAVEFTLDQSLPLALVLNEIICNSFKHALKEGGRFYLKLSFENEFFNLTIGDNGPGMKAKKNKSGLGLILIDILLEQIDAEKKIISSKGGLEYKIKFKLNTV